jgi:hypothetical protein
MRRYILVLISETVSFSNDLGRVAEILMTLTESFGWMLRSVSRFSHEYSGSHTS